MPVFDQLPRDWPTPTQEAAYYVTLTITRTSDVYTTTVLLGETPVPNSPSVPHVAVDDGLSARTVGIIVGTVIGSFIFLLLLFCCCYPRLWGRLRYGGSYTSSDSGSLTESSLHTTGAVRDTEPVRPATPARPVRPTRPARPLRAPIPVPTLWPLQPPPRPTLWPQPPRPAYTRGFRFR